VNPAIAAESAAALRGEAATITGAGGARRTGRRDVFFLEDDFFFVVFLRLAELVCFFFDVWVVPGCGATTKAVNTNRARALSLRYCILSG
jgi:hypothetical protein